MKYRRILAAALAALLLLAGCAAEEPKTSSAPSVPGRLAPAKKSASSRASSAGGQAEDDLQSQVEDLTSSLYEMQLRLDALESQLDALESAAPAGPAPAADEPADSDSPDGPSSSLAEREEPTDSQKPDVPDVSQNLARAAGENKDVRLWLQIPGTTVNEAVVQGTDNTAYSHRDWKGSLLSETQRENAIVLDYECAVGAGTAAAMPQNTVIYGVNFGTWLSAAQRTGWAQFYSDHYNASAGKLEYATGEEERRSDELSQECERLTLDDPSAPKFSQLLKFTDYSFARKTPYLYLTTPNAELIYEVFAVAYTNGYTDPPYNLAGYSTSYFNNLVTQMREKSLYRYDVAVDAGDKLLTLSTDTFRYAGKRDTYGDRAKFVVMARLMKEGDAYRTEAAITQNPSPAAPKFAE